MKHCLIVDDSDVIRKVARRILERLEFEVTEADSGQEAVERCRFRAFDVVLLDWHMPDMTGIEFIGSLRLAKLPRKPYIIYCTTENDPDDIALAFAAGADHYLLKPYDRESIQACLSDAGLL